MYLKSYQFLTFKHWMEVNHGDYHMNVSLKAQAGKFIPLSQSNLKRDSTWSHENNALTGRRILSSTESTTNQVSDAHPPSLEICSCGLAETGLAEFDLCLWLYNDKEST